MKEGGKIASKWQKRWCIIRGSDFCYYKKKVARKHVLHSLLAFSEGTDELTCPVYRAFNKCKVPST